MTTEGSCFVVLSNKKQKHKKQKHKKQKHKKNFLFK